MVQVQQLKPASPASLPALIFGIQPRTLSVSHGNLWKATIEAQGSHKRRRPSCSPFFSRRARGCGWMMVVMDEGVEVGTWIVDGWMEEGEREGEREGWDGRAACCDALL